jgi:hypothetical protein
MSGKSSSVSCPSQLSSHDWHTNRYRAGIQGGKCFLFYIADSRGDYLKLIRYRGDIGL